MVESPQPPRPHSPRIFLLTHRSDGTPAAVLEVRSPWLLDLGGVPTRTARSALERSSEPMRPMVEPASERMQIMLTLLGAGALAMVLLWAPIVLELRPAAASRGLVGYVLPGVLFAAFAVFYGLLRFVTAPAHPLPTEDDDLDGDRQPRPEQGRWKLRILAALGSVVHAAIYMQVLQ
jgi:hypothetical protein